MVPFTDRTAAGDALLPHVARELSAGEGVVVLGLPRGGVPVAARIAQGLGAPLDVIVVRKLGVPGHEELAFGALASGGVRVLNADVAVAAGLDRDAVDAIAEYESAELARREAALRGPRPPVPVVGRTAVLVDDGLATGATMRAAVVALRARGAARVLAAAPVGSIPACALLEQEADVLVCLLRPRRFRAVGAWYEDFGEVPDAEVARSLTSALQVGRAVADD
jgi:putative phosphoribosyl transferase